MRPATPQHHPGFLPGCRQPSVQVNLRMRCQAQADLAALDRWLAASLGLDRIPLPAHRLPGPDAIAAQAWRVLVVTAFLQQEARLPVFDPGHILRLERDPQSPETWQASARIASLDLIPAQAQQLACNAALQIVARGLGHGHDGSKEEDWLATLEDSTINPLMTSSHSGISTLPILREAFRLDIPFRHLGAGVYQLGWGRRSRMLDRSALDTDSAIGARLTGKKHWTAQMLRTAGLPAPEHWLVKSELHAKAAARALGWPLVVKPADCERSEGVTVEIRDEDGLLRGYRHALACSRLVLVERQVAGTCHRLMVGNGRLLYAVRRNPRSVTGDGLHSVAELIELERQRGQRLPPWRRDKPIRLDALCFEALSAQGLDAAYRPGADETVKLRLIESGEWGGDVVTATTEVHPDNVAIALRAARLFGLDNAGIDIISPDISQPWHRNGAIINEVNFAPQFGATVAAREKMSEFLGSLIEGDGRIPIEAFVGGAEALDAGLRRRDELSRQGLACWCTSHAQTFDGSGDPCLLQGDGLFSRCSALLLDPTVEALILVVQTDELLATGLPADRLTQVHACAGKLSRRDGSGMHDDRAVMDALLRGLRTHAVAATQP